MSQDVISAASMYREPGIFPADPIPVLIAVSHASPRTVGYGA